MNKKSFFLFLILMQTCVYSFAVNPKDVIEELEDQKVVITSKRIVLERFPDAFNPSIIKVDQGFLLIFRYCPDQMNQPWISHIGTVLLDDSFQPISQPELLTTRLGDSRTPSQSEDARLFFYRDRIFLIYNDNIETVCPTVWDRRDMFIAELFHVDGQFILSTPLKLVYEEKYHSQLWQKNWIPFESDKTLLLSYSLNPHEVLYPNLMDGRCYLHYKTWRNIEWKWGHLRGSTPAQLVDGEYFAFFHSSIKAISSVSRGMERWHYFIGAYTFSAHPPYEITSISSSPIIAKGFYTESDAEKRVIFPGSFVATDSLIYVAYGKDDREIWIATLDKKALKETLEGVLK